MAISLRISRRTTVLTAVVLAAGLAVTGCSNANLKAQADSARSALSSARSASFTLHLSDPRGELAKSGGDAKTAKTLQDASLKLTIDPAGDGRLGGITAPAKTSDPVAALRASGSFELAYSNAGHQVVALRSLAGVLYVRIDPAQYAALAGSPLPLDTLTGGGIIPGTGPAVAGIRSGKWLSLDLPAVYAKAKTSGLIPKGSSAAGPATDPRKIAALEQALAHAVTSHATYTSRASNGTTTLAYKVDARASLRAVVDVLGDPAFAGLLGVAGSAASTSLADANASLAKLSPGNATGTLTISQGHFRQVTADLGSIAALSKDPKAKQVKTARLIVDIDDSAPAVRAPAPGQVVQVDSLADALMTMVAAGADGRTPQTTN